MKLNNLPWPSNNSEAIKLQHELAGKLVLKGEIEPVDLVAGVDCSSYGNTGMTVGAVVVWSLSEKKEIATSTAVVETDFPYIPGLLAFRELPALLRAFDKLEIVPDAVICDGQGTAHMRGFGIACHLGLYLGIPTLGCGKSRLVGSYKVPGRLKGSVEPLMYKDRLAGAVVRSRTNVKPVFISPGHLISLDNAVKLALKSCSRYRLPDPVRTAHNLSGEVLKNL